ncbi:Lipase member M [Camelus dromedarius]|uniref:Lipase member M n=1 Tax=Camelus dromedarius TaxID=9838 RepID=A0A5N4DKC8_CAMDR|nr:Lipase member M [Camelus dromedarius]
MSKILSRVWIVSHRTEMWLLILVAYLFQRNVNSGHMPTKAVDPEAFMNIIVSKLIAKSSDIKAIPVRSMKSRQKMGISFPLTGFLKAWCNLRRQVCFTICHPNMAAFPKVKTSL